MRESEAAEKDWTGTTGGGGRVLLQLLLLLLNPTLEEGSGTFHLRGAAAAVL